MNSEIIQPVQNFSAEGALVTFRCLVNVGQMAFRGSGAAEPLAADLTHHFLYVT